MNVVIIVIVLQYSDSYDSNLFASLWCCDSRNCVRLVLPSAGRTSHRNVVHRNNPSPIPPPPSTNTTHPKNARRKMHHLIPNACIFSKALRGIVRGGAPHHEEHLLRILGSKVGVVGGVGLLPIPWKGSNSSMPTPSRWYACRRAY